ncbi:hypothetical protein P29A0810_109 [Synechococcus phage S-CAM8]|jgi:hypothetical protein|uniref:Gp130 n=1 Tax=Synechococcus phage S-CAM8 TaxID=754038 RepID=G8EXM7_9CAUD|nr:hypothetical protein SXCG_00180 [Synechococcus phage S-CAM8]AET72567.1 gp130 [Synechococcus phage S-CAM8]AGN33948.1 hypothetical protein SXCG_00180 [Synechococcus phage S-CAM8]AOV60045.1 hypothetical protein P29A0810_109 [Synechococcus phage S-CAM8]
MPSDIAKDIVQQIFSDDKAAAIDSINDALGAASYEAIQARKLDFAKSMGFDLDDTAQDAADEIADSLPDSEEQPQEVEVDGRKPEDPPVDELPQEENPEEDNETDS